MNPLPRIVYIPGKNPKPEPGAHRELLWRVLHAGLLRAQPSVVRDITPERFELAAWNHHYYDAYKDHHPELPYIERLLAGRYDATVDRSEAHAMHVDLQRVVRSVADRFPMLLRLVSDPAIRETIEETESYFDHRRDTGRGVREVVKRLLRGPLQERTPLLIIGHSLGSVIAWDSLWELTHEEGHDGGIALLTIGSPLGMRFVQARLLGSDCTGRARYPHLVGTWHNIAATGDLISLDPTLADDFAPMVRLGLVRCIEDHHHGVYTHYRDEHGLNPHRAYGYLHNPVVATRIAEWLWRHRQRD